MRRTGFRAVPFLFTLLASCASGRPPVGSPAEFGPAPEASILMAVYDSGFARIVAALPLRSTVEPTPLRQLRAVVDFRNAEVRWARLRGNAIIALDSGRTSGGWMMVVPPGHRLLRGMAGFVDYDAGPVRALLIRPAGVSLTWAGLLLVHHLSHLQDMVHGLPRHLPSRDEVLQGEVRIHWRMLAAADLLAAGRFRAALDTLLADWAPASVAGLVSQLGQMRPAEAARLDRTVFTEAPASEVEALGRVGFFAAALLIRYSETHQVRLEDLLRAFDRMAGGDTEKSRP